MKNINPGIVLLAVSLNGVLHAENAMRLHQNLAAALESARPAKAGIFAPVKLAAGGKVSAKTAEQEREKILAAYMEYRKTKMSLLAGHSAGGIVSLGAFAWGVTHFSKKSTGVLLLKSGLAGLAAGTAAAMAAYFGMRAYLSIGDSLAMGLTSSKKSAARTGGYIGLGVGGLGGAVVGGVYGCMWGFGRALKHWPNPSGEYRYMIGGTALGAFVGATACALVVGTLGAGIGFLVDKSR